MPKSSTKRLYFIPILSKALDVLEVLQKNERPMSLEAIYQRTHISKTTVYRILKTFVHRGYLAQSQDGLYRLAARPRKVRFGFGKQSADMPFSEEVTASLQDAATQAVSIYCPRQPLRWRDRRAGRRRIRSQPR